MVDNWKYSSGLSISFQVDSGKTQLLLPLLKLRMEIHEISSPDHCDDITRGVARDQRTSILSEHVQRFRDASNGIGNPSTLFDSSDNDEAKRLAAPSQSAR